jgi:hypothetical protein
LPALRINKAWIISRHTSAEQIHMDANSKTVVLILGILGGTTLLAIVAAIVFYLNCEECQQALSVAGEGASMMMEAGNAPGTQQMRELGCSTAMVIDMNRFMDTVAGTLDEAGPDGQFNKEFRDALQAGRDPQESGYIVSCEVSSFKPVTGPECAEVMRAYARGAGEQAVATAHVIVMGSFASHAYCEGIYDQAGTFLRDVDIDERM